MRRRILAGLYLSLFALLAPLSARAQQAESGLAGQLLDATTRAPIRAGVVELVGSKHRVLTDSLGRFRFPSVPPGNHAISASALGYRSTVLPAVGSPALVLLEPEPVPLPAIEALAQPARRSVSGIPLRVFGREQLLSGGDISAAEFVRWKVPMAVRPCSTFDWGPVMTTTLRPTSGEEGAALAPAPMATTVPEGPLEGMLGSDCINGSRNRTGPFMVMVDDKPVQYSDDLWQYRAWDMGRAEVMYQRSPSAAMQMPFALVRLYTTGYLARMAAHTGGICGKPGSPGYPGTLADSALAALCGR